MMNKYILVYLFSMCSLFSIYAQERLEITGIVLDENSKSLSSVSVFIKNAPGLGTITDDKGRFKIKIEQYKTLVFSYVGYQKKEVLIKDGKDLVVQLEQIETSVLDEVVITGTGSQRALTVTGATSGVDLGNLKSNPTSSISNALAGNVPGIMGMTQSGQPGKNISEFWIRGISTFGGGINPLILVDNIERDINTINIEDIETFTVLKDAAMTAIYGSRGANGVILITTKQGKEGKININIKDENTYNTRTITPKFADGITYASLLNESRITRNFAPIYQPEELELLRLGLDPDLYPNVDWGDLLLKDGAMTYRANLNMTGGGSTARYFISGSYVNEGGMYRTDETLRDDYNTNANYNRWNYRINTDIDVTNTTLLRIGVAGSLDKRNSPGNGDSDFWGILFGYSPIRTPILYSNGYVPAIGTGNQTNPWVTATQTGFNEDWTNRVQTNVALEQKFDFITRGLRFRAIVGYDTNNRNSIQRRKWPEQWRAERARDEHGNLVFTHISAPRELFQSSSANGDRREFYDVMFNYDRGFGNHNVGGAVRFTRDALIRTVNLGDDIKNGISQRNQALAGRVTYNWKYRYILDFNFGYTGSENFAKNQQYGFFPAVSGAWNISEEAFVKERANWLNLLKIRYSWGKAGNDQLFGGQRFPYLYTMSEIPGGYQWADYGLNRHFNGMRFQQVASPYVTWEIATKQNLGLDVALFRDKIVANVDYFDEKRTGIYMARYYLPSMTGLESTPSANVGAVASQGFDGRLEYKQRLGEVHLATRSNITYSKNKILQKDEQNNVYGYQNEKGYRVDQNVGLISLGLFKDYDDIRNSPTQMFGTYQPGDIKYKDVNGDGVIDDGDRVAVGSTRRPNLIYGLGASASWKGLDVSVHFQGAGRSSFFTYGKTVYAFSEGEWGQVLEGIMGDNRWISQDLSGDPKTENPNASYPRLSFGGNPNNYRQSTFWLQDGQYLRLKTLDIGYSLPSMLSNRIKVKSIRLFVIGTNLLTWSKFKLWDPELGTPRGEDYPLPQSYTMGININL